MAQLAQEGFEGLQAGCEQPQPATHLPGSIPGGQRGLFSKQVTVLGAEPGGGAVGEFIHVEAGGEGVVDHVKQHFDLPVQRVGQMGVDHRVGETVLVVEAKFDAAAVFSTLNVEQLVAVVVDEKRAEAEMVEQLGGGPAAGRWLVFRRAGAG